MYNLDRSAFIIEDATNTGVYNSSKIINEGSFAVRRGTGVMGIYLTDQGKITNHDLFTISGDYALHGIFLRGTVDNIGRAIIISLNKISVAGGTLYNEGFLKSDYEGDHSIYGGGEVVNVGAIDDNYNSFPSNLDNQQVVVKPTSNTMQVGVPYPNVLDIASLNNIDNISSNWRIGRSSGTSAGTYDINTNTFTPNAAAAGLTTIYFGIEMDGLSRNHSLEIPGGVLAASTNSQLQDQPIEVADGISNPFQSPLSIAPNPTTGMLRVQSELFENETTTILVFNTLGQLVHEVNNTNGDFEQQIDLPKQLSNGIYILQCLQHDQPIASKRIQLQR